MTRLRWWLALPAISSRPRAGPAAEVRDKAGMFSPEAVKKAQAELDRIERDIRSRSRSRPSSRSTAGTSTTSSPQHARRSTPRGSTS